MPPLVAESASDDYRDVRLVLRGAAMRDRGARTRERNMPTSALEGLLAASGVEVEVPAVQAMMKAATVSEGVCNPELAGRNNLLLRVRAQWPYGGNLCVPDISVVVRAPLALRSWASGAGVALRTALSLALTLCCSI